MHSICRLIPLAVTDRIGWMCIATQRRAGVLEEQPNKPAAQLRVSATHCLTCSCSEPVNYRMSGTNGAGGSWGQKTDVITAWSSFSNLSIKLNRFVLFFLSNPTPFSFYIDQQQQALFTLIHFNCQHLQNYKSVLTNGESQWLISVFLGKLKHHNTQNQRSEGHMGIISTLYPDHVTFPIHYTPQATPFNPKLHILKQILKKASLPHTSYFSAGCNSLASCWLTFPLDSSLAQFRALQWEEFEGQLSCNTFLLSQIPSLTAHWVALNVKLNNWCACTHTLQTALISAALWVWVILLCLCILKEFSAMDLRVQPGFPPNPMTPGRNRAQNHGANVPPLATFRHFRLSPTCWLHHKLKRNLFDISTFEGQPVICRSCYMSNKLPIKGIQVIHLNIFIKKMFYSSLIYKCLDPAVGGHC